MRLAPFALLLAVSASSTAGIVSTTGAVMLTAPPASVAHNAYASNTLALLFPESSGILTVDLTVDNNATGDYAEPLTIANAPGVVLPAGTAYQSYLLNADPLTGTATYAGSITFDAPIIGVIFTALDGYPVARLDQTDAILGNPGTSYAGTSFRATSGQGDSFSISADARTLTFSLFSFGAQDQIRIVLTGVPEPDPRALIAIGLIAVWFLRRAEPR